MLDGKRFLPETGMPILKIARKMVLLAVELPEPFLVPTVIEKSFTTLFIVLLDNLCHCEERSLRRHLHLRAGASEQSPRQLGDCFGLAPSQRHLVLRSVIQKVGVRHKRLITS